MPLSAKKFYSLLQASGLVSPKTLRKLLAAITSGEKTKPIRVASLSKKLVAIGKLSPYQAQLLAAGIACNFDVERYRIVDLIRQGRFSGMLRAQERETSKFVLLLALPNQPLSKQRHSGQIESEQTESCWPEELRETIERTCKHPSRYLLSCRQIEAGNVGFLLFEEIAGESLTEMTAHSTPLSLDKLLRLGRHLFKGLAHLHTLGVCHSAITPDNVWCSTTGRNYLIPPPVAWLKPHPRIPKEAILAPGELAKLTLSPGRLESGQLGSSTKEVSPREDLRQMGHLVAQLINDFHGNESSAQEQTVLKPLEKLVGQLIERKDKAGSSEMPISAKMIAKQFENLKRRIPSSTSNSAPPEPQQQAGVNSEATGEIPEIRISEKSPGKADSVLSRYERAGKHGKGTRNRWLISASILTLLFGLGTAWFGSRWFNKRGDSPPRSSATARFPATPETPSSATIATADNPPTPVQVVEDDGTTPWQSPTNGPVLDLRYLPASPQCIIALRPHELLESEEGKRLIAAMERVGIKTGLENTTLATLPWQSASEAIVALYPANGAISFCFLLRFPNAEELEHLFPRVEAARASGDDSFFIENGAAYFTPADVAGTIVVAPGQLMPVAPERDSSFFARWQIEQLLPYSDRNRHLTILTTPSFLFSDLAPLVPATESELFSPAIALLDDSCQGCMLSLHFDRMAYAELRTLHSVDKSLALVANDDWQTIHHWSGQAKEKVKSLHVSDFARDILWEFPRMLEELAMYSRVAVESKQVLVNVYLPSSAAHNLLLGGYLLAMEENGHSPTTSSTSPKNVGKMPLEELLAKRITITFPRDTLGKAIEFFSMETGIPVIIVGRDLEKEGITKNQSFSLQQRDVVAREVLDVILKLASSENKLTYVSRLDKTGTEILYITTRKAARERGEILLDE